MSDSVLQSALNGISSRENRPQRDWKTFIGQIAAVIAALLLVLLFVLFSDYFVPSTASCLVVDSGWQIVGYDPDTAAFFCLQSETGVYRLDCPVSVVECP